MIPWTLYAPQYCTYRSISIASNASTPWVGLGPSEPAATGLLGLGLIQHCTKSATSRAAVGPISAIIFCTIWRLQVTVNYLRITNVNANL
jgi:hypothetical protein